MFFSAKKTRKEFQEGVKRAKELATCETRKATEEESLKERLEAINNLDFWGADLIKEAREIEKRLALLSEEKEYKEWFDAHKEELRELFNHMKRIFLEGSDCFEMLYSGQNRVVYAGRFYDRDNLIKLLKRYGYHCTDRINGATSEKIKLTIQLERDW